jgi:predicted metal-binding membrane protein
VSRRRFVLVGALFCVIAAAWSYLLHGAGMATEMPAMPGMQGMAEVGLGSASPTWSTGHVGVTFGMWAVMMMAMMLPAAATAVAARGAFFALGYIAVWSAFAGGATMLQWGLERAGLLAAGMELRSTPLAALVVVAIGIYQLTPLKKACLRHCQSDAAEHADDAGAGFRANLARGMWHGLSCVGCCWALMLLLFVGGVMNMIWIAALTFFVLAERLLPRRLVFAQAAGVALVLFGAIARLSAAS